MVFYRIICTAWNILGDFSPLIPMNFMSLNEDVFLVMIPRTFSYLWVQVVMPSLSTLLAIAFGSINSWLEFISNHVPFFCSKLIDENSDQNIFFNHPLVSLLLGHTVLICVRFWGFVLVHVIFLLVQASVYLVHRLFRVGTF